MRHEPWAEEAAFQARLEKEHRRYLRGCPWCCVCDQQIAEPSCYTLDKRDFDACLHESCYKAEVKKIRLSNLSVAVRETLEELFSQGVEYITTPHEEV